MEVGGQVGLFVYPWRKVLKSNSMNANHFITEEGRKRVEEAIAEAEKRTSAEIVCAVATESGRYDRAESIAGLAGSLIGLVMAHAYSGASVDSGSWVYDGGLSLAWQLAAVAAGFVAGTLLASVWHGLRRLLVGEREVEDETRRAASAVFAMKRLRSTRESGGVLIYVSLFERRVVVLADDGVMKAAGQNLLDEIRNIAVRNLRQGKTVETFTETIHAAEEELSQKLPNQKDDVDELSNKLLIFHPRP
jgi:putative membrane protein